MEAPESCVTAPQSTMTLRHSRSWSRAMMFGAGGAPPASSSSPAAADAMSNAAAAPCCWPSSVGVVRSGHWAAPGAAPRKSTPPPPLPSAVPVADVRRLLADGCACCCCCQADAGTSARMLPPPPAGAVPLSSVGGPAAASSPSIVPDELVSRRCRLWLVLRDSAGPRCGDTLPLLSPTPAKTSGPAAVSLLPPPVAAGPQAVLTAPRCCCDPPSLDTIAAEVRCSACATPLSPTCCEMMGERGASRSASATSGPGADEEAAPAVGRRAPLLPDREIRPPSGESSSCGEPPAPTATLGVRPPPVSSGDAAPAGVLRPLPERVSSACCPGCLGVELSPLLARDSCPGCCCPCCWCPATGPP